MSKPFISLSCTTILTHKIWKLH